MSNIIDFKKAQERYKSLNKVPKPLFEQITDSKRATKEKEILEKRKQQNTNILKALGEK